MFETSAAVKWIAGSPRSSVPVLIDKKDESATTSSKNLEALEAALGSSIDTGLTIETYDG